MTADRELFDRVSDTLSRRALFGAAVVVLAGVASGCRDDRGPRPGDALVGDDEPPGSAAGDDGTQPTPATWTGPRADVISLDNTFRPATIEVAPGTMVVWTNRGRNEHDIQPVDPAEGWKVEKEDFPQGATFGVVYEEPGEHPYFCEAHGTPDAGMIGTVIVTA